jgi:vacuolar-type H+-ATPase subunit D/Vma8
MKHNRYDNQHAKHTVPLHDESVLPQLRADIKAIAAHLAEREREAHFRLKRFKERRRRGAEYGR